MLLFSRSEDYDFVDLVIHAYARRVKTWLVLISRTRLLSVSSSFTLPAPDMTDDSLSSSRTKRETAMLVAKWGAVDAVFILSFVPLLYLVKQWSY